jgi:hypothetical protein
VAADVVDGTRLVAMNGDEVVNRIVDRLLLRRKARRTAAAGWTGTDDDEVRTVTDMLTGDGPAASRQSNDPEADDATAGHADGSAES